jgi:hypothetical protein
MSDENDGPVFLVVAHTDSDMFTRLAKALYPHRVVAHIDRKSPQTEFERDAPSNVEFTESRVFVSWAGFSQVEAIEILLNHVREVPAKTPLVLLTGQDFPARNPEDFVHFLRKNESRQYVRSFDMRDATPKYTWQITRPHYQDIAPKSPRWLRRFLIFACRSTMRWHKLRAPDALHPRHGHANWVITREAATRIQEELARSEVRDFFKHTFAPDEKFVPTLLRSPDYESSRWNMPEGTFEGEGNWRYTNFHYIDASLRILTIEDLPAIRASGRYFVRKVATPASLPLIDALESSWKNKIDETPV